jgi:LysM repeat protein
MRHRSPARWLAPLALATCAFAVYAVVHHETASDGHGSTTSTKTSTSAKGTRGTSTTRRRTAKAKTYTVKSGDVLSAIAIKTGRSVAELESANPSMDASTLHPGQKLKLP